MHGSGASVSDPLSHTPSSSNTRTHTHRSARSVCTLQPVSQVCPHFPFHCLTVHLMTPFPGARGSRGLLVRGGRYAGADASEIFDSIHASVCSPPYAVSLACVGSMSRSMRFLTWVLRGLDVFLGSFDSMGLKGISPTRCMVPTSSRCTHRRVCVRVCVRTCVLPCVRASVRVCVRALSRAARECAIMRAGRWSREPCSLRFVCSVRRP